MKSFSIDNELDYTLYARMEAIHSSDKFSVPLIIVGDDILIGEKEITAELEKKVQRLSEAGRGSASLPGKGPIKEAFRETGLLKL